MPHLRLSTVWSDRRVVANGVVRAALPALVVAILACGDGAAPPQSPGGVADITIVPASALLTVGETRQFTATPRTATGDTAASVGITWSSSAPNVASVSAVGRVTATAVGEATIVASAGGISRGSRLRVEPPQVVDLVIAPDSAVIEAGDSRRFVATPRFAPGATEVPITSTWQSSAPAVAAVSSTGLVSAVSAGVALISAAYGDVRSTRAMRVVPPIIEQLALCWPMLQRGLSTPTATSCSDSLTLPPAWNAPVMLASPAKPWAEISPTAVRFEVADPTVVTFVAVDSLDYLPKGWVARALRPGTTTYTATVGTVSLRGRLTVRPLPARLTVASSDWVGGGSPRIESWGMDGTPDQLLVPGGPLIDTQSSLLRMNAGLEWSPDGSMLLFSSGARHVSLLSARGGMPRRFELQEEILSPSWDRDGTIVYSNTGGAVRRMQKDGLPANYANPNVTEPAYFVRTASNERFTFGCEMENPFYPYSENFICVQDSTRRVKIDYGMNPDWAPDESAIAFVSGSVTIVDMRTYAGRELHLPMLQRPAFAARWSRDGGSLAIVTWAGALWVVNGDGSPPMYRTATGGGRPLAVAWEP